MYVQSVSIYFFLYMCIGKNGWCPTVLLVNKFEFHKKFYPYCTIIIFNKKIRWLKSVKIIVSSLIFTISIMNNIFQLLFFLLSYLHIYLVFMEKGLHLIFLFFALGIFHTVVLYILDKRYIYFAKEKIKSNFFLLLDCLIAIDTIEI